MKGQRLVAEFAEARNWHMQLPDHVAKSISIESAELLEHFQWVSPKAEEIIIDTIKLKEISAELADVLIYSLHMANLLKLDAEKIIAEKLNFAGKKYPVKLMRSRSAGEPYAHDKYLAIKHKYRESKKHG